MQDNARIEMDCAFGAKTETFLADNRVSGIAAIEEALDQLVDPLADAVRQHVTDFNGFARYSKTHRFLQEPGPKAPPNWNQSESVSRDDAEPTTVSASLP